MGKYSQKLIFSTFFKVIFFPAAFCISAVSFAATINVKIENLKNVGTFTFGIGSEVFLEATDSQISGAHLFLGKTILPDGKNSFQIYLNKADQKIYYIHSDNFDQDTINQQPVLDPYEQVGGTCSGYAIYDFLQQSHLSGFEGTGVLATKISTESGRTALLVGNINEYYLTPKHKYSIQGILNKYGKEFGFKCRTLKSDSIADTKNKILKNLSIGSPVIIAFNLGPKMYKSPFALQMYQASTVMDERLWIPRKVGERNSGGHAIVATGSFEMNSKKYLVVIDSDWSEPRVWDMDSFLDDRTAIDEVEITSCN